MRLKKTLWIVNHYASTPTTGMGGRHYYLARELVRRGIAVYVVACAHTHLLRSPPETKKRYTTEIVDGVNYVWVQGVSYEHAHSKKRILGWFIFSWKLIGLLKFLNSAPSTILCSSPSLISFLGSKYLSWKSRAPLIFEVRDIWPLTFIEIGGYSAGHPFVRLLQCIEDFAYRNSKKVISNLPMAIEHMVTRGLARDKFFWIPNGISLQEVEQPMPLEKSVADLLPKGKFLVGYTGTLGAANAMDVLLQAAENIKNERGIYLVVVGNGRAESGLKKFAAEKSLSNVIFIDAVPKAQVQSLLAKFDVLYIGWRKDALYKFGIAPNKLPEYMYSGKPILHSYSGGGDVIEEFRMGITVPAEDPLAVANAVLSLYQKTAAQRDEMGCNAKKYVLENHDYSVLAERLAELVE